MTYKQLGNGGDSIHNYLIKARRPIDLDIDNIPSRYTDSPQETIDKQALRDANKAERTSIWANIKELLS